MSLHQYHVDFSQLSPSEKNHSVSVLIMPLLPAFNGSKVFSPVFSLWKKTKTSII